MEVPYAEAELALARRDLAAALRALQRYDAVEHPGAEIDPIDFAEKDCVRGQIDWESGADRGRVDGPAAPS